jgi:hypothetical protein
MDVIQGTPISFYSKIFFNLKHNGGGGALIARVIESLKRNGNISSLFKSPPVNVLSDDGRQKSLPRLWPRGKALSRTGS